MQHAQRLSYMTYINVIRAAKSHAANIAKKFVHLTRNVSLMSSDVGVLKVLTLSDKEMMFHNYATFSLVPVLQRDL